MKGKNLLLGLSEIDPKFIAEAETENIGKGKTRSPRRMILVAAVIALCLLLVGCGVAYVLKMQNLKIGEQEVTFDVFDYDPESGEAVEYVGKTTATQQVLTLTGLKGTPGYQATQEWFEFKKAYDPNYVIMEEAEDDPTDYPKEYDGYYPYSQEMIDKINEITRKYGLRLMGEETILHGGRLFYQEAGIDRLVTPESGAEVSVESATIYDGGSMKINLFFMDMPDEIWPYRMTNSMYYSQKDCFNPYTMEIGVDSDWEEWNYTTSGGQNVLLLLSDGMGWVICDRADATIAIRILTNGENQSAQITKQQFEQVADAFDYTMEPDFGGLVISFEGVDPGDLVQTRNGCTLELKKVETDGLVANITFGLTIPEDYPLEQNGEALGVGFASGSAAPASGETAYDNGSLQEIDDGDGLPYTKQLLLTMTPERMNEDNQQESALEQGATWIFHWQDLEATYWDGERTQFETLWRIEGDWQFAVTFDEGDFRVVEMVREPVTTNVVVGWGMDGGDVYGDAVISSLELRAMSAAILCEPGSAELTDYKNQRYMTVVLEDGTEVKLQERSMAGNRIVCLLEKPVDLDTVDHVRLADGTKLSVQ